MKVRIRTNASVEEIDVATLISIQFEMDDGGEMKVYLAQDHIEVYSNKTLFVEPRSTNMIYVRKEPEEG